MENIFHKLLSYCGQDFVPMHMPGHKRNIEEFAMGNPYGIDITEIDGFDNLHNPTGLIMDSMNATAQMYGAKKTFYLVNGSSVGILTAISAVAIKGHKVIVARNCHRSVYNAIYLNELNPVYVYPDSVNDLGINSQISAKNVDKLLSENKDVLAVVITSPTYEGIISDISAIAEVVHKFGIPLIVDEAHGAHFHFHEAFPESALDNGADIVVQSIHKTLPAFTQTALLHVKGDLIDISKVSRYLDMYQSTSPSYILMAGIDNCMEFLKTKGPDMFEKYVGNLNALRSNIEKLKYISLFHIDDISKLVLYVPDGRLSGKQLYNILLNSYHIQLEMASLYYVIAMTSVGDKIEYYDRFMNALIKIDNSLDPQNQAVCDCTLIGCNKFEVVTAKVIESPYMAMNAELELVEVEKSIGRISGSSVCIYPPGNPLIFPGEIISVDIINCIKEAYNLGLEIIGLEETDNNLNIKTEDDLNIETEDDMNNKISAIITDEIDRVIIDKIEVEKESENSKKSKKRGIAIQCMK